MARAGLTPLRALLIEDSADDAALIALELRRGGFAPVTKRVDTGEALLDALAEPWDVILSDHAMPSLDALDVVRLLNERSLDAPCIVVSGTIGEEAAVSLMRSGAVDYVNKGNLGRLAPAVSRALREVEMRRARRAAEEALRRAYDELEARVTARTAELSKARLRLVEVREEERRHFARELHDHAVQGLLGISYGLVEIQKQAARQGVDGVLKEMLEGQRDTVLDIVSGLRGLIRGLRPAGLDEFGLSVTLENYVASLGDGRGAKPVISSDVETDGLDLPPMVSLCLFRAAQEALRNALRHAGADTVMLRLCVQAGEPGALELAVQDDGRGFTVPERLGEFAQKNHFGLIGLEEQVTMVGGTLTVLSKPDAGTTVSVRVPLRASHQQV